MARFDATKTVVTPQEMFQAMALAWDRVAGGDPHSPSPRTISLLTAHWALETGSGASMMNYNVAGIKANADEDHTYYWTFEDNLGPAEAQAVVDRSTAAAPAKF